MTPTPTAERVLFTYTYAVQLLTAAMYKEAVPQFSVVIRQLPDYAQAYHGRGLAHYHEEQYALALEDFNKAIELKPDLAVAYRNRGILHVSMNSMFRAAADLEKALELYEATGQRRQAEDIRALMTGTAR